MQDLDKVVVKIEFELSVAELLGLRKLADTTGKSVETVARECMNSKCKELLLAETFKKIEEKQKELDTKAKAEYNEASKEEEPMTPREKLGMDCC